MTFKNNRRGDVDGPKVILGIVLALALVLVIMGIQGKLPGFAKKTAGYVDDNACALVKGTCTQVGSDTSNPCPNGQTEALATKCADKVSSDGKTTTKQACCVKIQ